MMTRRLCEIVCLHNTRLALSNCGRELRLRSIPILETTCIMACTQEEPPVPPGLPSRHEQGLAETSRF